MHAPDNLLLFWAKLDRESSSWHPLFCHLIDVGAVAREMWKAVLPAAARRRMSESLGLPEDEAGRWIAFWAACHDLGKLSPSFQLQDAGARSRLEAAGFSRHGMVPSVPHGTITTATLRQILVADLSLDCQLARRVATIVGGHHGVLSRNDEVQSLSVESAAGGTIWADARSRLARVVAEALGTPASPPPGTLDNAAGLLLAGLVSVADWVGSNVDFFPYLARDESTSPDVAPAAHFAEAASRARKALDCLGWTAWAPPGGAHAFAELFPHIPAPNAMQREVVSLAEDIAEPSLFIVEAPMGEGKSEAALYLVDRWSATLGTRGAYVALPTQATSNQMFSRVRDFLARRYDGDVVNLQLIHGHADLSADFAELRQNGDRIFQIREIAEQSSFDRAPAGVVAAEWFTHRKRGLLSPFGVGTIDQGLLAVLQTRHVFVRLFGLAHKTVIVDEVHAYDTYMTTLLERLLEWLGALGSSVVLLSATLPASRRARLLDAFARGLGIQAPAIDVQCYPRITWLTRSGAGACHVEASDRTRKTIKLKWVDGRLPSSEDASFPLGENLAAALADGGCAVVICNTVRRAQDVYCALKRYFPGTADDGQPELDLLHARYPFEERQQREARTLARFGKPGALVTGVDGEPSPVRRPSRAVLVATQIVEQSLDLDFDLMVTDFAPLDLLLQRCGRLHRHDRCRPGGLAEPALWICQPAVENEVPRFDPGTRAVYDEHILLRSWLALRNRHEARVPDEVEDLIEAVYGDGPCPSDVSDAVRAHWKASSDRLARQQAEEQGEAHVRWLPQPDSGGALWRFTENPREEDAPDFHRAHRALTRLADEAVPVVCLFGTKTRPSLDPAGHEPVDLGNIPSAQMAQRLLARSVAIADRRVVSTLKSKVVPSGWLRSPLLRHHRLLSFDSEGIATVGAHRVRLDSVLGLQVIDSKTGE